MWRIEGIGKTDSILIVKIGPSQREAGITHVLELFSLKTYERCEINFEWCMFLSTTDTR